MKNKKIITIIVAVVACIAIAGGILLVMKLHSNETTTPPVDGNSQPQVSAEEANKGALEEAKKGNSQKAAELYEAASKQYEAEGETDKATEAKANADALKWQAKKDEELKKKLPSESNPPKLFSAGS